MVKGVIFDFDGVVVESEPIFLDSVIIYLKRFGIEANYDDVNFLLGMVMDDIVSSLKEKYQLKDSNEKINKDATEIYEEICTLDRFSLINGLKEFLDKCKEKNIKMAVASSSDMNYLTTLINHFNIGEYFDFVISGVDLPVSKPDPLIYNLAAEKMGIDKKDLIIVEDAYNGILAGKRSGIFTYGLKASIVKQNTSLADKEVYSYQEIDL